MSRNLKVGDKVEFFGLGDYTPSLWIRLTSPIRWRYNDVAYWLRKQYQRLTTGFPHCESFDFYSFHAEYCVKRLKYLRNNLNGHPHDITLEQWQEILDKIIWSFEHATDDFNELYKYPDDYDSRSIVVSIDEHGTTYRACDDRRPDTTEVDKQIARRQEGLDLFAKFYFNLWD